MRQNSVTRFLIVVGLLGLFGCDKSSSTPGSAASSEGSPAALSGQTQNIPAPVAAPIVVEPGTTIAVTIDQTISSETNNSGDHFDASLAAPVMVGNDQVIPPGTKVSGHVTISKSAGKFKGKAELHAVTLDSIMLNGQAYPLRTTAIVEAGKARGKRTAIGAGGGAVVGGIIGALAGGGKGAAIGAVAGGGAGTAGAAYTGNRDIRFPAELRLNFKLKEPLEISGR